MEKPFSLSGKNILITGASSGIGRQCAIDCSKAGATIVLMGRNADRLNETFQLLAQGNHHKVQTDLNDLGSIKPTMESIIEQVGALDGFVHCAGIEKTLPIGSIKPAVFEEIYRVNALSAFEIIRYLSRKSNFNPAGSIVLISSITSVVGRPGVTAYSASKGAVVSAVKTLALEFAKKKTRVNAISPGTVLTPLMENYLSHISAEERAKRESGFPLGLGEPSDISTVVVFLLSDASRWITGQNLIVDGGYTCQ